MPETTDPRVARTRARVLAAAREVLLERGFAEVTIEHISARSGVARSTLYRHWQTREEILRDAFSAVALGPPPDTHRPGGDLRDDLRRYARTFADGLAHSWGRAAATLAATALDDAAQRAIMDVFIEGYVHDVAVLLSRAAERGEPVPGADPREVADRLVAPLFYRYLITHQPLDHAVADAEADRVHAELVDAGADGGRRRSR